MKVRSEVCYTDKWLPVSRGDLIPIFSTYYKDAEKGIRQLAARPGREFRSRSLAIAA